MNTVVKWGKEHAKSVAVWVAGVAVTAVMNLVNGVSPWPETGAQWTQYALTSFGLAAAAWLFPNKITQKQLDKDPNVVGGVVVDKPEGGLPGLTGTVIDGTIKNVDGGGTYPSSWR